MNPYAGSAGLHFRIGHNSRGQDIYSWLDSMHVIYVHKARTGIEYIGRMIWLDGGGKVLVPAYNCGSEIDALLKGGARVQFYRITRRGEIDIDDVRSRITQETRAIYVIHYFGFPQSQNEIKRICLEKGLLLIEDCALALLSCDGEAKLGTFGDVAVFSFPKSLAVPDGGALVINNKNLSVEGWMLTQPNYMRLARKMLPLLKSTILRMLSRVLVSDSKSSELKKMDGELVKKYGVVTEEVSSEMPGDYYFDENARQRGLSVLTKLCLRTYCVKEVIRKRRLNFMMLRELIDGQSGVRPLYRELKEGVCPLYFPAIVDKRSLLYNKMRQRGVAAIPWWAGYHRQFSWDGFKESSFLKDHILALPIHQDLEPSAIEYIANSLISSIHRL